MARKSKSKAAILYDNPTRLLRLIEELHHGGKFHGTIHVHFDGQELGADFEPHTEGDVAVLGEHVGHKVVDRLKFEPLTKLK